MHLFEDIEPENQESYRGCKQGGNKTSKNNSPKSTKSNCN